MASFTYQSSYLNAMSVPCSNLLGNARIGGGSGDITREWSPIKHSTETI